MTPIGPITPEERINSLDTLRGFALLGILPANVLVFGMYFAAGNDPTVAGGATGLNLASWALFRILIEGKMRCLFSMVFGASMILLTSRVEERSAGSKCRRRWPRGASGTETESAHTKRTGTGCRPKKAGMRAPGRTGAAKGSAKKLLIIGALFIAFKAGWCAVDAFRQLARWNLAAAAAAAEKVGKKPAEVQAEARKELEAQRKQRKPSSEELEKDAKKWRGNPLEVIGARAKALAVCMACRITTR